jgi:hypothetical protein
MIPYFLRKTCFFPKEFPSKFPCVLETLTGRHSTQTRTNTLLVTGSVLWRGRNRGHLFHTALNTVLSVHPIWIGYLEKGNMSMFQALSKSGRIKQPVHLHADNTHYVVDEERDTIHKHRVDMVHTDPTSFNSWPHYPNKMTHTRTTSVTSHILNLYTVQHKGQNSSDACRENMRSAQSGRVQKGA